MTDAETIAVLTTDRDRYKAALGAIRRLWDNLEDGVACTVTNDMDEIAWDALRGDL